MADRRATNADNTPVSSCPVVQTVRFQSITSKLVQTRLKFKHFLLQNVSKLEEFWGLAEGHNGRYKISEILAGDGITFGTGSTSRAGSLLNKMYLSSMCCVLERGFVKQKVLKSTFIKKGDKTRTIKTSSATFWD